MTDDNLHVLAGDIGGTTARLVLYEVPADPEQLLDIAAHPPDQHHVVSQMYYRKRDFLSFSDLLLAFVTLNQNARRKITVACFATAGPISDNRINFTNREGWIIDGPTIQNEFAIDHVILVNDFVAGGYGLLTIPEQDIVTVQQGSDQHTSSDGGASSSAALIPPLPAAADPTDPTPQEAPPPRPPTSAAAEDASSLLPFPATVSILDQAAPQASTAAPKAVLGAGTGLGQCFLTPDGSGIYKAYASEGGHVEFVPRSDLEEELIQFIRSRLDFTDPDNARDGIRRPRVSMERVVSAKGLENIYEFLRSKFADRVDHRLDDAYQASSERATLIGAESGNYKLFEQALEMMFSIYGGVAGNVALKYLPHGGLYVVGAIAAANVDLITREGSGFMRRFRDKGRLESIMHDFPVHVVLKRDLGLRGAHMIASRLAGRVVLERTELLRMGASTVSGHGNGTAGDPHFWDGQQGVEAGNNEVRLGALPVGGGGSGSRTELTDDTFRNAIKDYPLAYATAMSITAAVTAAIVVVSGQMMTWQSKSRFS